MLEVNVNTSSLKNSDYGTISGQIFIKGPAGYFPVEGWFDFPVVILGWWVQGLSEIASGKVRSFEAVFMDGPYSFVVDSVSGAIAKVAWKDRGCLSTVGTINILELLNSLIEASNKILGVCRAENWQNSDIENLERAVFGALPYLLTQN